VFHDAVYLVLLVGAHCTYTAMVPERMIVLCDHIELDCTF
jgi:hypothetical protein